MKQQGKSLVIVRTHRNLHYTTLKLVAVEDSRLSYKAKGLHTYLISRPPEWKIYYHDLLSRAKDGRDSITSGIKELKKYGYLNIERIREGGKIVGTIWHVFEEPQIQDAKPPYPEKPDMGKPYPENLHQSIITNNNNQNTTTTGVVIASRGKGQKVCSITNMKEGLKDITKGTPFEDVDYQPWLGRPDLLDQIDKIVQTYAEDFSKALRPQAIVTKVMRYGATAPDNYVPYRERQARSKADAVHIANMRAEEDRKRKLQRATLNKFSKLSEQERDALLREASVKLGPILGASKGATMAFALEIFKEKE
jgi:hypothetical protein